MASNARKKTTMAKLNREAAVRERQARKIAKKEAKKLAPVGVAEVEDTADVDDDAAVEPE
jgi:hypothetical protein